ncbi:MAG TPA: hypothetical protein VFW00_04090 [Rhodocyclaceae bacterium]|nr:hypothetical protein [Rhodocyclaceae bacterium]
MPNSWLILVGIGILMLLLARGSFRKPGVTFWAIVPVWRASSYLKPVGVKLSLGGTIIGLTGIAMHIFARHI